MPSIAVIAAIVLALSLATLKLAGVSAHLPPQVVPADIVAQNKALALREASGPAQIWVAAAREADQSAGPRTAAVRFPLTAR
jgi:hypothetical protein